MVDRILQNDPLVNEYFEMYEIMDLTIPSFREDLPKYCLFYNKNKIEFDRKSGQWTTPVFIRDHHFSNAKMFITFQVDQEPGTPEPIDEKFIILKMDSEQCDRAQEQDHIDIRIVVPYRPKRIINCSNDFIFMDSDYFLKYWDTLDQTKIPLVDENGAKFYPDLCKIISLEEIKERTKRLNNSAVQN